MAESLIADMSKLANEYLAWERFCRGQAELCATSEGREAFLGLAAAYHQR
jgi:hypothetical protein